MARLVGAALLAGLVPFVSAGSDADTITFAVYGDWGWSNAGIANYTYLNMNGNGWGSGVLARQGLGQLGQQATAQAMAAQCASQNCDFALNTGDNFYDMGVSSVNDPQWQTAFQGIYGIYPSLQIPHMSIFGNHDYLNDDDSMYSQIAYTYAPNNSPAKWWAPGRNWTAAWASASGKTTLQLVAIDTSPLIQAYFQNPDLLNSTGKYNGNFNGAITNCTTAGGQTITKATVNLGNQGAYVRGAGTGFAMASQFGTLAYQCGSPQVVYKPTDICTTGSCGCTVTSGALSNCAAACVGVANMSAPNINLQTLGSNNLNNQGASPGFRPSSCHHAVNELLQFAQPQQQQKDMQWATNLFQTGAGHYNYQILANHHPVLAPAFGRNDPLFSYVTQMIASLGAGAPQASFNGHDHVIAALQAANTPYSGTTFFTSGAAGIANVFPSAAGVGVWLGNDPTDPDSANVLYGSNTNGYFIVNAGPSSMTVAMYLVNCGQTTVTALNSTVATPGTQAAGVACQQVNGNKPVWSKSFPTKTVTAAGRRKLAQAVSDGLHQAGRDLFHPQRRQAAAAPANPASLYAPAYYSEYYSQVSWSAASGYSVQTLAAVSGRPVAAAPTTAYPTAAPVVMPTSGAAPAGGSSRIAAVLGLVAAIAAVAAF